MLSIYDLRAKYVPYGLTISHNSFGDYVVHHPSRDPLKSRLCDSLEDADEAADDMLTEIIQEQLTEFPAYS